MTDDRLDRLIARVQRLGEETRQKIFFRILNYLLQSAPEKDGRDRASLPGFEDFLDSLEGLEELPADGAAFSKALDGIERYIRFSLFGRKGLDFPSLADDRPGRPGDGAAPGPPARPRTSRLSIDTSHSTRRPFSSYDEEKVNHPEFQRLRWQIIRNAVIDTSHMVIYDRNNTFWELHANLTDSFIKDSLAGEEDAAAPAFHADHPVLYIATRTQLNHYGHWLAESLSSLAVIEHLPENSKVILPENLGCGQRQTLELTGLMAKVQFVRSRLAFVSELIVPSTLLEPFRYTPYVRHLFYEMAQNAGRLKPGPPGGPARRDLVYLSRLDCRSRKMRNEPELISALADLGFRIVAMAELPVVEQIRAIQEARLVVSPYGAALMNVLFSFNPELAILELFPIPEGVPKLYPYYAYLSRYLGINHHVICFDMIDGSGEWLADTHHTIKAVKDLLKVQGWPTP